MFNAQQLGRAKATIIRNHQEHIQSRRRFCERVKELSVTLEALQQEEEALLDGIRAMGDRLRRVCDELAEVSQFAGAPHYVD